MPSQVHLRFNKKTLDRVPLPAAGQRATFHDIEIPGLQLRVTDRGVKSFCVFRRSKRGTPERITIGRFRRYRWNAPESRRSDTSRISERALVSVHGCATRHSKQEHSRK